MGPLYCILVLGCWQPISQDSGEGYLVEVCTRDAQTQWVRAGGTLAHGLDRVRAALHSFAHFEDWVPSLNAWEVWSRHEDHAVIYARHAMPWPIADRDYLVRCTWEVSDTAFTLRANSSFDAPAALREREASRRAKGRAVALDPVQSAWHLTHAGDNRTHVTYTYLGTLGLPIPRWLLERLWRSEGPALLRSVDSTLRRLHADEGAAACDAHEDGQAPGPV